MLFFPGKKREHVIAIQMNLEAFGAGFVALEQAKEGRRQTPFTKCEIRWRFPVCAGDTITGNRRVLEKYGRRGNKFVTFRVDAVNQNGQLVAEYDYTCIFEYAKGQREAPSGSGNPQADGESQSPQNSGPDLLDFGLASVGDKLAGLAITESREIMNRKNDFRLAGRRNDSNIHTDEEFAKQNIFGSTTNSGPATMSYVDQMLELSFPTSSFYSGGSLLMRAITPFRGGDTVRFEGEVTSKSDKGEEKTLECRVKGINQRGELVCLSDAVLLFE